MSVKKKVGAIAAALTTVCGMSAAAAIPASAATPACGQHCIGVFSSELGTFAEPNFVEHVFGGVARIDTETGLTTASSTDSSQDFVNPHQGDVSDYYSLGLVSADVDRHYSGLSAAQLEYAPLGQPTGLCVGVPTSPYSGEALSLQPCTVPGRTVWIIGSPTSAGFFPIISGATTDFGHPFAMTYPRHVDTDTMLPPIRLFRRHFRGPAHAVPATQLWGVKLGVL